MQPAMSVPPEMVSKDNRLAHDITKLKNGKYSLFEGMVLPTICSSPFF